MENLNELLKSAGVDTSKEFQIDTDISKLQKRLDEIQVSLQDNQTSINEKGFLEDERKTIIKKMGKLRNEIKEDLQQIPAPKDNYPNHEG
jgi:valyl-tRNA synthetase